MMMFHIPVMILMTVLMYAMVRLKNNISRPMGALLVAIYVAYVVIMALNPSLTI